MNVSVRTRSAAVDRAKVARYRTLARYGYAQYMLTVKGYPGVRDRCGGLPTISMALSDRL